MQIKDIAASGITWHAGPLRGALGFFRHASVQDAPVSAHPARTAWEAIRLFSVNGEKEVRRAIDNDGSIDHLLRRKNFDVNHVLKNGFSLLSYAARHNRSKIVHRLLEHGADINQLSGNPNETALWHAVNEGHTEIVNILLGSRQLNLNIKGAETPLLSLAIEKEYSEIVKALWPSREIILNNTAICNGESLIYPAVRCGRIDMIELLVALDPGLWSTSEIQGRHPFYVAAAEGYTEIVQYCVEKGIDPAVLSKTSNSLLAASSAGHLGVVRYLIGLPDIKDSMTRDAGEILLRDAATHGWIDICTALLEHPTMKAKSTDDPGPYIGNAALVKAAANNHVKLVPLLFPRASLQARLHFVEQYWSLCSYSATLSTQAAINATRGDRALQDAFGEIFDCVMKISTMFPIALSLAGSGVISNANLKKHGEDLLKKIFLKRSYSAQEGTAKINLRNAASNIGSTYIEQFMDANSNGAGVAIKTLKDLTTHENHAHTMAAVMWASLCDIDADPDLDTFMALFKNVETKGFVANAKACIVLLDCEGRSGKLLNRTDEDAHQRLPKLTKALVEFFVEASNRKPSQIPTPAAVS